MSLSIWQKRDTKSVPFLRYCKELKRIIYKFMIWRIFVEIKIVAKENISIAINNALCYYTIKSENIKKIS